MAAGNIAWMSTKPASPEHDDLKNPDAKYGRSAFLRDYGAIIHSSKFRRLAYKTQVYLNPQIDYPRTRLPHSVEVSQIGRQLARALSSILRQSDVIAYGNQSPSGFAVDFEDLVATACLAHDLGQPPFGHQGERTLGKLLINSEAFEANKQNVRLLLGTMARSPMEVSCALVDAVMKYKDKDTFKPKKSPGHYSYEADKVARILDETQTASLRHPACYLMEAADDIAYISGDIEDAVKLRIINAQELVKAIGHLPLLKDDYSEDSAVQWKDVVEGAKDDPGILSSLIIKALVKNVIDGLFAHLKAVSLVDLPKAMDEFARSKNTTDEKLNIMYCGDLGPGNAALKHFIYQMRILKNSEVAQSEHLAAKVISELWAEISKLILEKTDENKDEKPENHRVFYIVPEYVRDKIKKVSDADLPTGQKKQIVADYISGMTDRYAIDLWSRLNSPERLRFVG